VGGIVGGMLHIAYHNLADTNPAVLWKRYIQLTEAEWAFRITKDELSIRPIWHQKPHRVQAHILVCFLAYVMWKTLRQWMKRSGLGDAPRTLLQEFAKIKERRCHPAGQNCRWPYQQTDSPAVSGKP
jgi:hypothetical protein